MKLLAFVLYCWFCLSAYVSATTLSVDEERAIYSEIITLWIGNDWDLEETIVSQTSKLDPQNKLDVLIKTIQICNKKAPPREKINLVFSLAPLSFVERQEVTKLAITLRELFDGKGYKVSADAIVDHITGIPNYLRSFVVDRLKALNCLEYLTLDKSIKQILEPLGCISRGRLYVLYRMYGMV